MHVSCRLEAQQLPLVVRAITAIRTIITCQFTLTKWDIYLTVGTAGKWKIFIMLAMLTVLTENGVAGGWVMATKTNIYFSLGADLNSFEM